MKNIPLFLSGLFLTLSLQAQWDNNGINLTTSDNVGIGTTNPLRKLQIDASYTTAQIQLNRTGSNLGKVDFGVDIYGLHFWMGGYDTFGNEEFFIGQNGNVGIGTSNPDEALVVNGNISFSYNNNLSANGLRRNGIKTEYYNTITGVSTNVIHEFTGANTTIMSLTQGGQVGIGTLTPGSWKLAVNGNIRAKEIKVETGWSDFVFYDNYELPSLDEVEKQIKEKGHLKDIPSAEEVAENGIFLGKMDAKLLQKIEELTLYTIQQQKRLKSLDSKIEKLELENKQLKSVFKRLNQIEKLLSKETQN